MKGTAFYTGFIENILVIVAGNTDRRHFIGFTQRKAIRFFDTPSTYIQVDSFLE